MSGMHQDADLVAEDDGVDLPESLLAFVAAPDHAPLLSYLDALLTNSDISDADLALLFRVQVADWSLEKDADARALFEELRRVLRNRVKSHA